MLSTTIIKNNRKNRSDFFDNIVDIVSFTINIRVTHPLVYTTLTGKELVPSSKIVDAYLRLPQHRNITPTGTNKRRSLDPSLWYRLRHPSCNILSHLNFSPPLFRSFRQDRSFFFLKSTVSPARATADTVSGGEGGKLKPQKIIAAQRAVTRAIQHTIAHRLCAI